VGVDVDVAAATRQGVVVNSPEREYNCGGRTCGSHDARSVAIPDANSSVKSGKWDRKSFIGSEVYKKPWALSAWVRLAPMLPILPAWA